MSDLLNVLSDPRGLITIYPSHHVSRNYRHSFFLEVDLRASIEKIRD